MFKNIADGDVMQLVQCGVTNDDGLLPPPRGLRAAASLKLSLSAGQGYSQAPSCCAAVLLLS